MKNIKTYIITVGLAVLGVAAATPAGTALAYNPLEGACSGNTASEVCTNQNEEITPVIGIVVNTLLYIIGILAVIMVIVSGIMYTISTGDSSRVSKAKNMLIYAIVGLVVAFIAYALVNWVFKLFTTP